MGRAHRIFAALAALSLVACNAVPSEPDVPEAKPVARPAAQARAPEPAIALKRGPSQESVALAAYYARVEADLLVQGLLRTDGGGPDTPFTDTMLMRNFVTIALAEEYARGAGLRAGTGDLGRIKKWTQPVRMSVEFGRSVPEEIRNRDRAEVTRYTARLARVTGHPITMSDADPNFHVLFMSEDDRSQISRRIRQLVPNINAQSLAIFDRLPRSIHCLVIAFSGSSGGYDYAKAIALIRAEHPPLLRKSCIHEELAQGLGLSNDSPLARPSIFNDDDEFALLTTHDEMLLKLLYNPRMRPGMDADATRAVLRDLLADAPVPADGPS